MLQSRTESDTASPRAPAANIQVALDQEDFRGPVARPQYAQLSPAGSTGADVPGSRKGARLFRKQPISTLETVFPLPCNSSLLHPSHHVLTTLLSLLCPSGPQSPLSILRTQQLSLQEQGGMENVSSSDTSSNHWSRHYTKLFLREIFAIAFVTTDSCSRNVLMAADLGSRSLATLTRKLFAMVRRGLVPRVKSMPQSCAKSLAEDHLILRAILSWSLHPHLSYEDMRTMDCSSELLMRVVKWCHAGKDACSG